MPLLLGSDCPRSLLIALHHGRRAVLRAIPCKRWECPVCGERRRDAATALAEQGIALARESLIMITITVPPNEASDDAWRDLRHRWIALRKRLVRRLKRPVPYFLALQPTAQGRPHAHVLVRDTGHLAIRRLEADARACGLGHIMVQVGDRGTAWYVTQRAIEPGYPRSCRRFSHSADWAPDDCDPDQPPAAYTGWRSLPIDGFDPDYAAEWLCRQGYEVIA